LSEETRDPTPALQGAQVIRGSCHCGACNWTFDGDPGSATACNCTVCRRYGALWIYDWVDERITVSGPTVAYTRGKTIGFNFCPTCGCVAFWRALQAEPDGRRRIAVNIRLAEDVGAVSHLPIDHFDGLDSFDDLPRDGRTVHEYWF
jgi:hypothetical protein